MEYCLGLIRRYQAASVLSQMESLSRHQAASVLSQMESLSRYQALFLGVLRPAGAFVFGKKGVPGFFDMSYSLRGVLECVFMHPGKMRAGGTRPHKPGEPSARSWGNPARRPTPTHQ